MKTVLFLLIMLHGLIHLLGFAKGLGLWEAPGFTLTVGSAAGILWGVAGLLTMGFGLLYLSGSNAQIWAGLLAAALSQALIFTAWGDARWGTLANLLILLLVALAWGRASADRRWEASLAAVTRSVPEMRSPDRYTPLTEVPGVVQAWLQRSGALGREPAAIGIIGQRARLKLKPGQETWLEARAWQRTNLAEPAFAWRVNVPLWGPVFMDGLDQYLDGNGSMYIALQALLPVVNETGPMIDEGAAQRFLGEMVWFPGFALSPYVSWEESAPLAARATLRYGGREAAGTFHFNGQGEVVRYEALRFKGNAPEARRYPWVLEIQDYREFDGVRVPSRMTATWMLEDGPWTWMELEVTALEVQYSVPK